MYCPSCGAEQAENSKFCRNCGVRFVQAEGVQPGTAYTSAVEYAGFWRRFGAAIIDGIIINVASFIIGLIIGLIITSAGGVSDATINVVSYLIGFLIYWLYYALMESSSKQATPGKMALGIIVTDNDGNRISLGRATGRLFAKYISTIILFIGFIMIAFTPKKQGLHDMMASTLVVLK